MDVWDLDVTFTKFQNSLAHKIIYLPSCMLEWKPWLCTSRSCKGAGTCDVLFTFLVVLNVDSVFVTDSFSPSSLTEIWLVSKDLRASGVIGCFELFSGSSNTGLSSLILFAALKSFKWWNLMSFSSSTNSHSCGKCFSE